jgi:4-hydroxybenzoate polyprenyltransferase
MFISLIQSLRPKQWTKNLLLFAGLLFSISLFQTELLLRAALGFIIFCLLSSGEYLIKPILLNQSVPLRQAKSRFQWPS